MYETPRPLQQSDAYASALHHMGRQVIRVGHSGASCQFGIARRAGPLRLAYLPRGSVPDWRDVFCGGGPGLCVVIPDTLPSHAPGCPILTPQHVAELDLRPGPDTLWNGLHGKWRNRLRRALEGPVVTVQERFDPPRHAGLIGREEAQRKQRRYRSWPRSFLTAFSQVSAAEPGSATSSTSRANPPVKRLSLWQLTQYRSNTSRTSSASAVVTRSVPLVARASSGEKR